MSILIPSPTILEVHLFREFSVPCRWQCMEGQGGSLYSVALRFDSNHFHSAWADGVYPHINGSQGTARQYPKTYILCVRKKHV